MTTSAHYDAVIIGAGMSGLAAAVRLGMFGQKVLVVERHNATGGLNSSTPGAAEVRRRLARPHQLGA